jgi:hypothetical protein
MLKQRTQTTKAYKSSPYTYATPPEPNHTSPGLVHAQQPKPVTPVFLNSTLQKPKNAKQMHKLPLTLGIGSRNAMQLFSPFFLPHVANA